jgi:arabinofuranosyltransferase
MARLSPDQPMPIQNSTSARRLTLTVLLLLFAIVLVRTAWVSDDAYITFRTSDNLLNGYGMRWNVVERVQAFTHPLWMLLVTAAYGLSGHVYGATLVLSFLLSLVAVWLIGSRARSLPGIVIALTLAVMSKAFVDYSTSGLESPLSHVLLVAFALMASGGAPAPRRVFWLALTAALLTMNRPDLLVLVAPWLAWSAWRLGLRQSLRPLVLGFAPFIAWELFSLTYFGFLVPNTAYAKLNTAIASRELLEQGFYYLLESAASDPVTLLAIGTALLLPLTGRARPSWPMTLGIVLYLIYVVRIGGDFMSGRFLTPAFVLAAWQLAQVEWDDLGHLWVLPAAVVVLLGLSGARPPVLSSQDMSDERRPRVNDAGVTDERLIYYEATGLLRRTRKTIVPEHRRFNEGLAARARGRKIITQSAIGFFGFAAGPEVHVVDLLALSDPLLARLPARRPWNIGHYYRRAPEGYVETLETGQLEILDPGVAAYYKKLQLITQGPIWTRERWKAILFMNLGRYESLIAEYGLSKPRLAELQTPKPAGTPWDAAGNLVLYERGARVELGQSVNGGGLEMSVGGNDDYEVGFWSSGRQVGWTVLRAIPENPGTLVVRRVAVPPGKGVDRVTVRPVAGDHVYSLGHLRLVQ